MREHNEPGMHERGMNFDRWDENGPEFDAAFGAGEERPAPTTRPVVSAQFFAGLALGFIVVTPLYLALVALAKLIMP